MDDNDELKDIESYKSKANDVQLKKKIIPSLFNDEGPQEALEAEKEKKTSKSKTRRKEKRKKDTILMQNKDEEGIEEADEFISKKAMFSEETISKVESDNCTGIQSDKKN